MMLKDIGENRLIKELARRFSPGAKGRLIRAVGDDTSVSLEKSGMALLCTTDTLIEGTHYLARWAPAYLLGRKAVSISLSDIAAMGGVPLYYLVSVALRPDTSKDFIYSLYRGMNDAAEEFNAVLAGGNTARTRGPAVITTTLLGEAPSDKVVYRSGAKEGDAVYVTGTLGDSALGLLALKKNGGAALKKGPFKKAALKHLDPSPRLAAGAYLALNSLASSMIDISDGLMLDLKRLCEVSGVGARVEAASLPISSEMKRHLTGEKTGITLALTGGEDYELLFTSPEKAASYVKAAAKRLRLPITPIGRITGKKKGVVAVGGDGFRLEIAKDGFEHF